MSEVMAMETVTVDMIGRTVESDGETLPVVWWADMDGDPCPFAEAARLSAGPDRDGLFVQVAIDMKRGRVQ